jgi:hypothetical protein
VIRGHLYVESALIQQIESAIPNKDGFDTPGLLFILKVNLAVALARVDPADAGALKALNRLRVKFAHNLETAFLWRSSRSGVYQPLV